MTESIEFNLWSPEDKKGIVLHSDGKKYGFYFYEQEACRYRPMPSRELECSLSDWIKRNGNRLSPPFTGETPLREVLSCIASEALRLRCRATQTVSELR